MAPWWRRWQEGPDAPPEAATCVPEPLVTAVLTAFAGPPSPGIAAHVRAILGACADVEPSDQVAYLLATADHESGFGRARFTRSVPLVEDHNPFTEGPGGWRAKVHTSGRIVVASTREDLETAYWDAAYGHLLGNRPGTTDGRDYRGRGYVQLTGRRNYARMTEQLGASGLSYRLDGDRWGAEGRSLDLVAHPDHVHRVEALAARILVDGSRSGSFTGHRLDRYIDDRRTDFVGARRVVNGTDRAAAIARMAEGYAAVLRPSGRGHR